MDAVLDMSGALYLPQDQMLVVSDMHLEKGTSWARRGIFLPPYDTKQTLAALALAVAHYRPRTLVYLGDSFHDAGGPARLDAQTLAVLTEICIRQDTFWITGNHDPQKADCLPGNACAELGIGAVRLVHIPGGALGGGGEIAGHLHPAASVVGRGRAVKRRCFVTDGQRMILPAFGSYTGGLNIRDDAFKGMFERNSMVVHVIGERQIYSMPLPALGR
jgi:uncharacterized protein